MLNLKALLEEHEDWLTERVVTYATENDYTEYSSTLREAWRIAICRLSEPLIKVIETAQSSDSPRDAAIKEATDFGISQALQHRSLGVNLKSFTGLLKLYRNAYLDLVHEKETDHEEQTRLHKHILELFDSIELGLLTAWEMSNETERLKELQSRNLELSNEKNKYLTVFESIAEPAILLDAANAPTHVNASAYNLLLGETEPGAGYYGDLDNPSLLNAVTKILNCKGRSSEPITLETPSGQRQFSVSIQHMLDISRKFDGQVIILQDVTDYQKAIETAQTADRAKTVFLTTISHEIRTPINSILGLTGLLEEQDLPASTLKHLRSIHASGEMLSALIENVLGLSKVQANALQLVEQDFNLLELCEALFQVLELKEPDQQLALESRIAPDVPLQLHGDGHKLRHILLNLLSNAVKYTDRGTITLAVSLEDGKPADRPTLRFEVIDTGVGVRDSDIDRLFEPFSQGVSPNATVATRGSGLGLAISKYLIEFLGGQITYHPNPAGGSIFSFSLSFDEINQSPSLPKHAQGHTILVVEDDPVNAIVIEGYLKEFGNVVTIARSYQEAAAALDSADFDIVVADYRLGEKNGLDVAKLVQKTAQKKAINIPVIVVSAAVPQDAARRMRQSGVGLFLEKPFSRYELANALSSFGKARDQGDGEAVVKPTPHLSDKDLNRLLTDLGFERCQAVVHSYQSNLPSLVSGMRTRLDDGDLPGVSELAHQLESASGFIGAWRLVQTANELRALCRTADQHAIASKFAGLSHDSELTRQDLDMCWNQIVSLHVR